MRKEIAFGTLDWGTCAYEHAGKRQKNTVDLDSDVREIVQNDYQVEPIHWAQKSNHCNKPSAFGV